MGGKKKYIEMYGSFTEPFNCDIFVSLTDSCTRCVCLEWCKYGIRKFKL